MTGGVDEGGCFSSFDSAVGEDLIKKKSLDLLV